VLLLKTMLVLHIALVLVMQHLRSGSQNGGGGGVINAGNQIKVAQPIISSFLCTRTTEA
jgi:hypothetical protein